MDFIATNRFKTQLGKVLNITVGWVIVSIIQYSIGLSVLNQLMCDLSGIDQMLFLRGSVLTGLMAGLLGGSTLVFLWEKWLRSMKYSMALFHIWWTFTFVFIVISLSTMFYVYSKVLDLPIFDQVVITQVKKEIVNLNQILAYFVWSFIVGFTLIMLQIGDKYGPGVFWAFLMGKYYHPKREQRIFMFLDLRSSTSIAEKLGEAKYFNFLKDIYETITPSIIYSKGEIYQYVGDEIVISWKTNNGIKNSNCINCFLKVQKTLHSHQDHFKAKYGVTPEFKAGLHCGFVMTGEIGVIKKDIAFSGDVLNTTSRIQSKCNDLGVDILFSNTLLDMLSISGKHFNPREIGEIKLRGKEDGVQLFTL